MTTERVTKSIRQDWDERARKNAFFYIASWRSDWNPESFFQSGEEDYDRLVGSVLNKFNFAPDGKTMIEVGCGAGRMTRSFARRFGQVVAVDISSEMQERAKQFLAEFRNIQWVLADGATLNGVDSASSDFVFSYLVLQHLPSPDLAHALLREFSRVLRPGGAFLFQYNGAPKRSMNLYGRLMWSFVNALWSIGWKKAGRSVASAMKLDPEMVGKSWHGASLTAAEVRATLEQAGVSQLQFWGDGTPMAWCWGSKAPEDRA
jgi:SAM-dependent methyltransferase